MKGFLCFIGALTGYLVLGLVLWNIVCSIVDIGNVTIDKVADYKLYTYSGLTLLVVFICGEKQPYSNKFFDYAIYIGIGILAMGILVNHWESVFASVAVILSLVYNIANIALISLALYYTFGD